jgi:phosphoserine phosphatase
MGGSLQHHITLLGSCNTPPCVVKAQNFLRDHAISIVKEGWVAPELAYDFITEHPHNHPLMQALTKHVRDDWGGDIIITPAQNRLKKLLIADMDATMVEDETLDIMADILGIGARVAQITTAAMQGELDFKTALIARVKLLKGAPESILDTAWKKTVFSKGAKILVQTMKARGAYCVLVSGGFTFFTQKVASHLGFDAHFGNVLESENGHLTGEVRHPILDQNSKLETLQRICNQRGISSDDVLAIGDGANDLPMLKAAGLGIAYRAKPAIRTACHAQLNHADLSAALYAQGVKNWEQ